jgi:hypothetical protein
MDIIAMIQAVPGVGPYLPYILVVFGICAVVAAQLPPPRQPGSLYDIVYRIVNLLGHNYNQAANATAPTKNSSAGTPPTTALVLIAVLALPFSLGACSYVNAAAGAANNFAAGQIAATTAAIQAADDNIAKALVHEMCAIPYGEVARNGSGNVNFPLAVIKVCGSPAGTLVVQEAGSVTATTTAVPTTVVAPPTAQ